MSVVIRLEVPIEMHYTVIPMGTSKINSSATEPLIWRQLRLPDRPQINSDWMVLTKNRI